MTTYGVQFRRARRLGRPLEVLVTVAGATERDACSRAEAVVASLYPGAGYLIFAISPVAGPPEPAA